MQRKVSKQLPWILLVRIIRCLFSKFSEKHVYNCRNSAKKRKRTIIKDLNRVWYWQKMPKHFLKLSWRGAKHPSQTKTSCDVSWGRWKITAFTPHTRLSLKCQAASVFFGHQTIWWSCPLGTLVGKSQLTSSHSTYWVCMRECLLVSSLLWIVSLVS